MRISQSILENFLKKNDDGMMETRCYKSNTLNGHVFPYLRQEFFFQLVKQIKGDLSPLLKPSYTCYFKSMTYQNIHYKPN